MPHRISSVETMPISKHKGYTQALLISLINGELRCYSNKTLLHIIQINENIKLIRFGQYSRQDNTLGLITKSGELIIQMLKRTAKLEMDNDEMLLGTQNQSQNQNNVAGSASSTNGQTGSTMVTDSSSSSFGVVRKSQLLLDQSAREKAQALDIHRAFQVIYTHMFLSLIAVLVFNTIYI